MLVFSLAVLALILLADVYLLFLLSAPSAYWPARAIVGVAWFAALTIACLMPLDVADTVSSNDNLQALTPMWKASYALTQAFTWAILPLAQIYQDAGDFTFASRIKTAVKENLVLGSVLGGLCIVLIGIVVAHNQYVTINTIGPAVVALSNTFGITCEIFLLGYGLVEIPRIFFRRANTHASSRKLSNAVGNASMEMEKAFSDLMRLLAVNRQLRHEVPRRHQNRWALDIIQDDVHRFAPFEIDEKALQAEQEAIRDEMEYDYEELSDLSLLRRRLKRAMDAYRRCRARYEQAVYNAIESEDVASNRRASANQEFLSTLRPNKGALWKRQAEWQWKCRFRLWLYFALGTLASLLGIVIAVGETCILMYAQLGQPRASVVSWLLVAARQSEASLSTLQAITAVPLAYICVCAYFSLFELGMFSFYAVQPHNSSAVSLLLNAILCCRFSAPVCFNFIDLVKDALNEGERTQFEKALNAKNIPAALEVTNQAVPTLLIPFCLCIVFDVFPRVGNACAQCCEFNQSSRLQFGRNPDASESSGEIGATILAREKESVRQQERIGDTHSAFVEEKDMRNRSLEGGQPSIAASSRLGGEQSWLLSSSAEEQHWEGAKERLSKAARGVAARPGPDQSGGERGHKQQQREREGERNASGQSQGRKSGPTTDLDAIFANLKE